MLVIEGTLKLLVEFSDFKPLSSKEVGLLSDDILKSTSEVTLVLKQSGPVDEVDKLVKLLFIVLFADQI